tara:strand:+ start:553 stop:807 length:255 start_codon:yes stop_codon:yes gene_type:complete
MMIGVGDLVQTKEIVFIHHQTGKAKHGRQVKGLVIDIIQKPYWDGRPIKTYATVLAYGGREHRFLLDDLEVLEKNKSFFLTAEQ